MGLFGSTKNRELNKFDGAEAMEQVGGAPDALGLPPTATGDTPFADQGFGMGNGMLGMLNNAGGPIHVEGVGEAPASGDIPAADMAEGPAPQEPARDLWSPGMGEGVEPIPGEQGGPEAAPPAGLQMQGGPEAAPPAGLQMQGDHEDTDKGEKQMEATERTTEEFVPTNDWAISMVEPAPAGYAGELAPNMEIKHYIGNTQMLLNYVRELESTHHITMPIRMCGIDPIVFDEASKAEQTEENRFTLNDGENIVEFELVKADGELYMSSMSRTLDSDYLKSVIREATTQMAESGQYIYFMVGYRELAFEEGQEVGSMIRTLRLNTYELSVLCDYLKGYGAEPVFGKMGNRQCIRFSKSS